MDTQFFNSESKKYNSIEIPIALDTRVRQSLAIARKKRMKAKIIKSTSVAVVFFAILVSTVNIFPQVAKALSSVPVLDKLISLISFDQGLKNAVEKGALQAVFFSEEKNGVKLTITSIAGDQNHLWVGYTLEGEGELQLTNPHITDIEDKPIPHFSSIYYSDESTENYFEIGFVDNDKLPSSIKLLCSINKTYKSELLQAGESAQSRESAKVADFEVPITLDENIFKNDKRLIEINNKSIKTDIGTLNLFKLNTSTTRTSLEFTLSSDKYKFMSFKNPRLEDNLGKIYSTSSAYSSLTMDEKNNIDFQGEINNELAGLTFKCDGIYYIKTKEDFITVDLKNKLVEPNSFGFRFVSLKDNQLIIAGDNISTVNFDEVDAGSKYNPVRSVGVSTRDENGKKSAEVYLDLGEFEGDKLTLKVSHLIAENMVTKPYSINLIP
jgi:hypothetical protein